MNTKRKNKRNNRDRRQNNSRTAQKDQQSVEKTKIKIMSESNFNEVSKVENELEADECRKGEQMTESNVLGRFSGSTRVDCVQIQLNLIFWFHFFSTFFAVLFAVAYFAFHFLWLNEVEGNFIILC